MFCSFKGLLSAVALTTQLPSAPKLISCCAGQRKVLWHNMREEPVLYINGNPHVVREANKPFANLEYTGQQAILAHKNAAVWAEGWRGCDPRPPRP